jgi:para-nitrobenzyl esterase
MLGLIPRLHEPDLYEVVAEYTSRQWKAHAVDEPARILRQNQDHVYAYRFDWDEFPTLMGADLSNILGASHGFEIPFVLGDFEFGGEMADFLFTEKNRPGRLELSKRMRTYWAEFARTGRLEPDGGTGTSSWLQWDPTSGGPKYMILDSAGNGGVRMGTETYDAETLRETVRRDDRLSNQRERCVVFRAMATYVGHFGRKDYEGLEVCEEFEWMDYPWRGTDQREYTSLPSIDRENWRER